MRKSRVKPRARELGVLFEGNPGRYNAITDVEGVKIGHTIRIEGKGQLMVGKGPIRTGVTAILPGENLFDPVFAGWACLNGNARVGGECWGRHWHDMPPIQGRYRDLLKGDQTK